jgi:ABC-2 type transport system permease protein
MSSQKVRTSSPVKIPSRIGVVIRKEMKEIRSSHSFLIVLLISPVIIAGIISEGLFLLPASQAVANASLELPFFGLLYPSLLASMIAFDSFIGERTKRTIEPLLAAPISERDLFIGKMLAAFIPAICVGYAVLGGLTGALFFRAGVAAFQAFSFQSVAELFWLAPVLSIISTSVITIVSGKVNDSRTAMGIGNFIIVALLFGLVFLTSNPLYFSHALIAFGINASLTLAAVLLVWVGIKVFNRESLLSRI